MHHRWVRGFHVASVRTVVIRLLGDCVWPTAQLWSMVRTDHDEPDEDPADYESEGRLFEPAWAHPMKSRIYTGNQEVTAQPFAHVRTSLDPKNPVATGLDGTKLEPNSKRNRTLGCPG